MRIRIRYYLAAYRQLYGSRWNLIIQYIQNRLEACKIWQSRGIIPTPNGRVMPWKAYLKFWEECSRETTDRQKRAA
jgi:hypothetical protein